AHAARRPAPGLEQLARRRERDVGGDAGAQQVGEDQQLEQRARLVLEGDAGLLGEGLAGLVQELLHDGVHGMYLPWSRSTRPCGELTRARCTGGPRGGRRDALEEAELPF